MDGWMDGWQFYRKTSGRTDVGYFSRWTCFKLESIASGFFAASLCMMRHGMCSFCNKFNNLTYLHLLILLGSQAGVWTWKSQPFVGEKPATSPGVSTWEGSDFDHRERGAKRVTRHFFGNDAFLVCPKMGSNSHQKWPVCSLAKWNMFFLGVYHEMLQSTGLGWDHSRIQIPGMNQPVTWHRP